LIEVKNIRAEVKIVRQLLNLDDSPWWNTFYLYNAIRLPVSVYRAVNAALNRWIP